MQNNTNLLGSVTELKCILYFMELGYIVSIPQTPVRYDFILDTGKELLKIQVKTSKEKEDGQYFEFATASSHQVNGKVVHTNYKNQGIDYFCTYHNNQCYLVNVESCGLRGQKLRLKPTSNGQTKNIMFAKDFIAKDVLGKISE